MKKNEKVLKWTLAFLIVYTFWGFLIERTIFYSQNAIYAAFLLLFAGFALSVKLNGGLIFTNRYVSTKWLLYVSLTAIGYLFETTFQYFFFWMSVLFMLSLGITTRFAYVFPYKVLFYSGCVGMIGTLFEFFFKDLYIVLITPFFMNSSILQSWVIEGHGLSGFTYQLDQNAAILLYLEAVILYASDKVLPHSLINYKRYILLVIITCIMLCGKRSFFMLSLFIPLVISVLGKKKPSQLFLIVIVLSGVAIFIWQLIMANLEYFAQFDFIGRYAQSLMDYQSGEDVSSGRSDLSSIALRAFWDNPIIGVGAGQFINYTHAYTDVHNVYLQTLCEQGIFVFIIFLFSITSCFRYSIHLLKKHSDTSLVNLVKFSLFCQMFYVIYGFSGNPNVNLFGFMMYFSSIAIIASIKNLNNENHYMY